MRRGVFHQVAVGANLGANATQESDAMKLDKIKPVLKTLLIVFVLYAIFTSPDRSADIARSIWDVISNGVKNLGDFFDNLLGKK